MKSYILMKAFLKYKNKFTINFKKQQIDEAFLKYKNKLKIKINPK